MPLTSRQTNKISRSVIVYFLLFSALLVQAQECKITLSNEFPKKDISDIKLLKSGKNFFGEKVNYSGTKIIFFLPTLKKHTYGIELYKYDENMNEIQKVSLDNGDHNFGPFSPLFKLFGNKLLLFYYRYDRDEIVRLFMAEVDAGNLTLKSNKEIYSYAQKNVGSTKAEEVMIDHTLSVYFSPDKTKMLIAQTDAEELNSFVVSNNLDVSKRSTIQKSGCIIFQVTSMFIDNNGNKYFAYRYFSNKKWDQDIRVENNMGKEAKLSLKINEAGYWPNDVRFTNSYDNSKVFLYANYANSSFNNGVLLSTIDAVNLKIEPAQLFPYSDAIRKSMYESGYGSKTKDSYGVRLVTYELNQLSNGVVMLSGIPDYSETVNNSYTTSSTIQAAGSPVSHTTTTSHDHNYGYSYSGPIVNIAINNNIAQFAIIPRRQEGSKEADGWISVPCRDKMFCIYNDIEENINAAPGDKVAKSKSPKDLCLVMAIFGSDGNIISKKRIAENAADKNYFFITDAQKMSDTKVVIPIGKGRMGYDTYTTGLVQWLEVEVK